MTLRQVRHARSATVVASLAMALSAPAALAPSGSAAATAPATTQAPPPAVESEIIPDRYIVTIDSDASNKEVREVRNDATDEGAQVHHTYTEALNGFAATMSPDELAAFRAEHPEASITADRTVHAFAVPEGLDRIDQRRLPLDGTFSLPSFQTGAGVTAFVLDTGLRVTHSEFAGRVGTGRNFVNDNYLSTAPIDLAGFRDCNGHGTHTAGTLGGATYGVARQVTIVPLRVLDCGGSGSSASVIAGINWVTQWAVANPGRAAVANMSLGAGSDQNIDDALRASTDAGVTYAVAAGNKAVDACRFTPARAPSAITVGATEVSSSRDRRVDFSNFGSCVDIWAPGKNILSAWYTSDSASNRISGTSMASPHVAGVAALYLQANPGAEPAQVAQALKDAATPGIIDDVRSGSPNLLLFANLAPVLIETIDQSAGTVFAGSSSWKLKSSSKSLGGDSARSKKKGATAGFTFTGTQISWIARTNDDLGKAAVYIDGEKVDTVNLYEDGSSYREVVFTSDVLSSGSHTITIKVLAKKSSDSDGKTIDVDGWIVRG